MPSLTIFANFYIDSDERYLRMVDSFNSFSSIRAEKWVVNARGQHAKKTQKFLKENLGEKLVSFSLASKEGWFYDTKQMLSVIDTDFVFFWLEDHINLVNVQVLEKIVQDMYENKSDYLEYSWWHFGKLPEVYKNIEKINNTNSKTFTLTKENLAEIEKSHSIYIISMAGLFSNRLFKKVILKTRLFLRQHPKQTPFNFEKGGEYKKWLPIKMTIPNQELFANIDDDHNDPGYSLQSRNLYPIREKRPTPECSPEKSSFSQRIKKLTPNFLYKRLIKVLIFINKVNRYLSLVSQGK